MAHAVGIASLSVSSPLAGSCDAARFVHSVSGNSSSVQTSTSSRCLQSLFLPGRLTMPTSSPLFGHAKRGFENKTDTATKTECLWSFRKAEEKKAARLDALRQIAMDFSIFWGVAIIIVGGAMAYTSLADNAKRLDDKVSRIEVVVKESAKDLKDSVRDDFAQRLAKVEGELRAPKISK